MKQLYVMHETQTVGILKIDNDLIYSFEYSSEWLKAKNSFPLSLSIPLEKKTFGNKITLSFFENLLPEGDIKSRIEKAVGINSVFDFLEEYGQDCAGAITLTTNPLNTKPLENKKSSNILLDEEKIYSALEGRKSIAEVIAEEALGYLSIAGAQDKFSGIYLNKKFYIPAKGYPTTHIIKMPISRSNIKDSVYNELFCMKLARSVGFTVPKCLIHYGKYPLFVIERYDREKNSNNKVSRVHQQDFCQAQGVTSEQKYESKGGPSIKDNYKLILNNITGKKRIAAINTFLDWIAFNLLIGNNDCHSKNISLLLRDKRYELAPIYDLLCTAIYPKHEKRFSFKIGDRDIYTVIGRNEFAKLDQQLEIKDGTFQGKLQNMHNLITKNKREVAKNIESNYGKIKIISQIIDLIADRAKSFSNQKGLTL